MTRFNTFNSLMSASSQNDDEEEEEEPPVEDNIVYEEETIDAEEITPTIPFTRTTYVEKHVDVEVISESKLETEYTDASYWRVIGNEDDLDELLKDFE